MPVELAFEDYRGLLFGIAYRMLGSAMEAEDVVQEAYLRSRETPPEQIRSPKAFYGTVVTRLCLDRLKSAQAQRETYPGPWLPEPLVTTDLALTKVIEIESISMAFLVLLESLTPVERAVFLLREVFDYEYADIARMVEKDESACRQIFHRAKQHITEHRPRFTSSPEEQQQLLEKFLIACGTGDMDGLMNLLADDVTSWSDGGGKAQAATRPVRGKEKVGKQMLGIAKRARADFRFEVKFFNGQPGIVYYSGQTPLGVVALDYGAGQIQAVRFILNPDKLKHLL